MTEISISQPLPPPTPTTQLESSKTPQSWLGRAMLDTIGRRGAQVGLVWIVVVAFCAVFAPVLANSYPILIRMDGRWSSPMLQNLTAVDWSLFAGTAALIGVLFLRNWSFMTRAGIVLGATLLTLAIASFIVNPTRTHVYDIYRVADQEQRVEWVLNAPVPYSPTDRLRDQFDIDRPHPWAPSAGHWLGTEVNGADILSNLIHACRIAMSIGFISTGIAVVIAIVVGGMMGYFVRWVDLIGMRLVEIFAAVPTIYLLLMCVAFFGRNLYLMMVIIGLTGWVGKAYFVRAEFLKLRNQDFVHAARAAGLPLRSILFRHILPNALAPLLVSVSFSVASAIVAESTLSFLGLGLIDEPSWGRLLSQAVGASGRFVWWLALFPGLAIFLTVLSYNLIGEALRDAVDPKLRGVK